MNDKPKSIVVWSGGQDSTTCLVKALKETEVVGVVFFDYSQKHKDSEWDAIMNMKEFMEQVTGVNCSGIVGERIELPFISYIGNTNLTEGQGNVNLPHEKDPSLPSSFVPGRNLIFLTIASMLAYKIGATQVWTGVCETDYSGYPDCRETTMRSLEDTINKGFGYDPEVARGIQIITPLMHLDKADTFKMAEDLGVLDFILEYTHTGYNGSREHRYEWGYGPAEGAVLDPASAIRARGWEEYKERYGK